MTPIQDEIAAWPEMPLNDISEYSATSAAVHTALVARLNAAMQFAVHKPKCIGMQVLGNRPWELVCNCGYTTLRERLVSEGLL